MANPCYIYSGISIRLTHRNTIKVDISIRQRVSLEKERFPSQFLIRPSL